MPIQWVVQTTRPGIPDARKKRHAGGHIAIIELSRRNTNHIVSTENGRAYFVKQAADEGQRRTLTNDAAIYAHIGGRLKTCALANYLPHC